MIQLLASTYRKRIAYLLLLLFECSFTLSSMAAPARVMSDTISVLTKRHRTGRLETSGGRLPVRSLTRLAGQKGVLMAGPASPDVASRRMTPKKVSIGGPNQPEMSSFKTVDDKNMVNLFTGDFNYNIPLLDVGGYPVNIFYSGDVGVEQEASWVGLGWNINPGNINRNMRGIPDDFDGTENLVQTQNTKPNKTWGVSAGADAEVFGYKTLNLGANMGVSFNNYLGIALDLGFKGGIAYKVGKKSASEKMTDSTDGLMLGASAGIDINSREGLTFSPGVSMTASNFNNGVKVGTSLGASTSYNSRTGVKAVQLSEQVFYNKYKAGKREKGANFSPLATAITFARPSYIPELRLPLLNSAYAGHIQVGTGFTGGFVSFELEIYKQTSSVSPSKIRQSKPMVGYLYYEKAMNNPDYVMDFTRLNDREVTPHTPVISAPQYTYDVFSIQGEGTGGSIRAYRSDLGYVRDNVTTSQDNSGTLGGDIGPPDHYGLNINAIHTPSSIGEWGNGNKLKSALAFQPASTNSSREHVYFRNPGETTVLDNSQFTKVGGTSLVRYQLSGNKYNPAVEPKLELFTNEGASTGNSITLSRDNTTGRTRRTQVVSFLTASEAARAGLDKTIRSYNYYGIMDNSADTLLYETIDRVKDYRLGHHISEIDVTESNGKRYVYGIPVYNVSQKDMTFTVSASDLSTPGQSDKVSYSPAEACALVSTGCPAKNAALDGGTGSRDGYVQVTETPAYAHSFLLSGLLSPDYVDLTGDGISDDDLGNGVKFNYSRMKSGSSWDDHLWRTPFEQGKANFNPGNRSNVKDDKGLVTYGQREAWYMHSIESKTMIAIFVLQNRNDNKSIMNEYGDPDNADTSLKSLKEIDLYSKSDLRKNGFAKARPIKTVHFVYNYTLCQGTPTNNTGGKLTLERIFFTYSGQSRQNKEQYVFAYTNSDNTGNPDYEFNASDRWGTYKSALMNPDGLRNSEYPYTSQDLQSSSPKAILDANAGAWSLKKILLPSGGQLEVQYESDDYAFVQNKRATDMMSVAGFGKTALSFSNRLYGVDASGFGENNFLFINVPASVESKNEVYQKYLQGLEQIAVKLAVYMPSGLEYLTVYAPFDDYGFYDATTIWVHMKPVNGISPLSLTAIEYLREQLPKDAFPGYDVSESSGIEQVGEALNGMWSAIKSAFSDVVGTLRSAGKAKNVLLSRSFARLNDPDGYKFGGGQRVKSVTLRDNWNIMKGAATSAYTQVYDYTTTETFNGAIRTISSGVASYEPTLGGEENPFQNIIPVANKLPLGPTSYGAIENPILDGFFQAPCVGYSKVTVRSLPSAAPLATEKSRSAIGRQVTQFYTAKDFPVSYYYTPLEAASDMQAHENQSTYFLYKYSLDSRAISQGFLVSLNDMHGKMLSQSSYAANDTTLLVNYTQNFYRNTGVNGLNEQFNFVHASHGDSIETGNMGVDIELMTDTREFSVNTSSKELQLNTDILFFGIPIPTPWPVVGKFDNVYRAVTTTKIINYHAVLDSVVVLDKGSQVSTKNLVYDGETGEVIVNRTNNEFNQPIYSTNYPAWWAYSGMGPASRNIGMQYSGLNFYQGKITTPGFDQSVFESGDELYIDSYVSGPGCDAAFASGDVPVIWAFDQNKNSSSLTQTIHNFIFLDKNGNAYTDSLVSCKVIRSGKRNLLDQKVAAVTSMASPVIATGSGWKLAFDANSNVVNASAISYREKWQADRDVIQTYRTVYNPNDCSNSEVLDCSGHLEKKINPYTRGLLGNFRDEKNLVYYGSRAAADANGLSKNGFLDGFSTYWSFNSLNNLVPDVDNAKWLWKEMVTRVNGRGLELETKNALGIYTAAQYGYNKNLPTAITSNSAYFESAYEGFEDYAYDGFISADSNYYCANQQHLDLSYMTNSQVVNTDALTFQAHTGKYVLGVNAHSAAQQTFSVTGSSNYDYVMNFGSGITSHLNNPGGNATDYGVSPGYSGYPNAQTYITNQAIFSGGGLTTTLALANNSNATGSTKTLSHNFGVRYLYYIIVASNGNYHFSPNITGAAGSLTAYDNCSFMIEVSDLNGNSVIDTTFASLGNLTGTKTAHMCTGIYRVMATVYNSFLEAGLPAAATISTSYAISLTTDAATADYKDLSTVNECTYVIPMPGNDSMLNPKFSLSAGKQVLVSAWVHEDSCGVAASGGPCNQTIFSSSKIIVNGGGADVTLSPSGPIIEGWQRFEGFITPPANDGSGYIKFSNTSDHTIYFDDIRIHPYNADMKTYVYDPVNLRLVAECDGNNYATFYEYDEEGTPIRVKAETREGIKTIKETRSAKQKSITVVQQ